MLVWFINYVNRVMHWYSLGQLRLKMRECAVLKYLQHSEFPSKTMSFIALQAIKLHLLVALSVNRIFLFLVS
jgi:hypothetical protein